MYRRNEYQQIKKEFMDSIENEYRQFKSSMLLKSPKEVYDSCNIIRFYECIYEYFQYNENVNSQFINRIHGNHYIISELKYIYDKYEYLTIDTWKNINDIINCSMAD